MSSASVGYGVGGRGRSPVEWAGRAGLSRILRRSSTRRFAHLDNSLPFSGPRLASAIMLVSSTGSALVFPNEHQGYSLCVAARTPVWDLRFRVGISRSLSGGSRQERARSVGCCFSTLVPTFTRWGTPLPAGCCTADSRSRGRPGRRSRWHHPRTIRRPPRTAGRARPGAVDEIPGCPQCRPGGW